MEIDPAQVQAESAGLQDVVKVIRWYQHFIHVKLLRGLSQREILKAPEELQSDANGSVKIALIAMDRSLGAWAELRQYFPEQTDSLLSVLVHLDRLRRQAEKEFPDARRFVRPGFDTGEKSLPD